MKKIIKSYLKFYKICLKEEKRDFNENTMSQEFYRGKIYEMELVVKDLTKILKNDIGFIHDST